MQIGYLADHPAFIPTLAQWHHAQWSYLSPGETLEDHVVSLGNQTGRRQIPTTLVAYQVARDGAETVLGSASLIEHDMDTRPELSPWMASVYVAADHRRQGIGSALVRRIAAEATALGVHRLYLFTPDQERFYARLGWSAIERCAYRGYAQVVMALDLHNQDSTG